MFQIETLKERPTVLVLDLSLKHMPLFYNPTCTAHPLAISDFELTSPFSPTTGFPELGFPGMGSLGLGYGPWLQALCVMQRLEACFAFDHQFALMSLTLYLERDLAS